MCTKEEQFYKNKFNNFFKEGDLNDFESYKNQRPHNFDNLVFQLHNQNQ